MMTEVVAPIFNFAVVALILVIYGKKPMRDFLAARSKNIETQMREAEIESREAKKVLGEAEKSWSSSEAHAKQQMDETQASLKRWKEQTLATAKNEAERVRKEAGLVGNSEVTRAKVKLQRELAERSVHAATAYLEKNLQDPDKHKLVSDYVESLGNGTAG